MNTPETVFIVGHYASQIQHNDALVHCIRSIRDCYGPDVPIYVIDDYSKYALPDFSGDVNVIVESNPFRQSGEVGCFYWFYANGIKRGIERAYIIHDSMMCLNTVRGIDSNTRAAMLWYFDRAYTYHQKEIEFLLKKLKGPYAFWHDLFHNGRNRKWVGCFGISCFITHDTLTKLHDQYGLFNTIGMIKSRELRMAMERVFGMILCTEIGLPMTNVCGCIFDHPDMSDESKWALRSYEEKRAFQNTYNKPFLKTWFGR